jgi:hypothetical protein
MWRVCATEGCAAVSVTPGLCGMGLVVVFEGAQRRTVSRNAEGHRLNNGLFVVERRLLIVLGAAAVVATTYLYRLHRTKRAQGFGMGLCCQDQPQPCAGASCMQSHTLFGVHVRRKKVQYGPWLCSSRQVCYPQRALYAAQPFGWCKGHHTPLDTGRAHGCHSNTKSQQVCRSCQGFHFPCFGCAPAQSGADLSSCPGCTPLRMRLLPVGAAIGVAEGTGRGTDP